MIPPNHPLILGKKHLAWLSRQGAFVAVPEVKTLWKRQRDAWLYHHYDPRLRLREVLPQEVVIEFDGYASDLDVDALREEAEGLAMRTCDNLDRDRVRYIVFDHGGKSPHIHVLIDGLQDLDPAARKQYKEAFVRKYAAEPAKADLSLCGEHLIATEYALHWKYARVKREVRNMLPKHKIADVLTVPCAACGLLRCEYVDPRGVFYCSLCAGDSL